MSSSDTSEVPTEIATEYATVEEKLRLQYGYVFDQGVLKNCESGEGFKFVNQKHYEALGDVILDYIQEKMRTHYGLEEVWLPLDYEGPQANIFVSRDWSHNERGMLVLIQGTGAVRAGQWARSVCINGSLDIGTVFPCLEFAQEHNLSVVVMNPNCSFDPRTGKRITRIGSSDGHCHYAWAHFVTPCPAAKIFIICHSAGGYDTTQLLLRNTDEFISRVKAIAYTDSGYGGIERASRSTREYFKRVAAHWVGSKDPLGTFEPRRYYSLCTTVSAGHHKHEYTTGAAQYQIFEFFKAIDSNPDLLLDEETKTQFFARPTPNPTLQQPDSPAPEAQEPNQPAEPTLDIEAEAQTEEEEALDDSPFN